MSKLSKNYVVIAATFVFAFNFAVVSAGIATEENPTGDSTVVDSEITTIVDTPTGDSTAVDSEADTNDDAPTGDSTAVEGDTPDQEIEETPENNSGGSSGGSSGGRRSSRTTGEVLGALSGESCGMYLLDYMKIGMDNNPEEVKKLQTFLNGQGFVVPVTGFFGPLTDAAVKAFQTAHAAEVLTPWLNLGFGEGKPTGYVFKTTKWKINNIVCPGSEVIPVLS